MLRLFAEPQQFRRRAAEDRDLVGIAETGRAEDMPDRIGHPLEAIIRADHDEPRSDLDREVAQPFGREHHRIDIDALRIHRGEAVLERRIVARYGELPLRAFLQRRALSNGADIGNGGVAVHIDSARPACRLLPAASAPKRAAPKCEAARSLIRYLS